MMVSIYYVVASNFLPEIFEGEFSEDCSSDVSSDDEDSENGGRYKGNNAFSVLDD